MRRVPMVVAAWLASGLAPGLAAAERPPRAAWIPAASPEAVERMRALLLADQGVLETLPDGEPAGAVGRGAAALRQGRLAEAARLLSSPEATASAEPARRLLLAEALRRQGRPAAARRELEQAARPGAGDARHRLQACAALRALGAKPAAPVADEVLGVVVEHRTEGGLDSLAAYVDGAVRHVSFSGALLLYDPAADPLRERFSPLPARLLAAAREARVPRGDPRAKVPAEGRFVLLACAGPRVAPSSAASVAGLRGPAADLFLATVALRPEPAAYAADCERGAALACAILGRQAANARDVEHARLRFARACTLGDPVACSSARVLELPADAGPEGTSRSEAAAVCAGGDERSCGALGLLLLRGAPAEADLGRRLAERACDAGAANACHGLAMLHGGGAAPDPARSLTRFEQGCAAGLAVSCTHAGVLRAKRGEGEAATTLLERGCGLASDPERGGACLALGRIVRDAAAGVARDPARALTLLRAACDAGRRDGCYDAGAAGRAAAPSEYARALADFEKACAAGLAAACNDAGLMVDQGLGAKGDAPRAVALLRKGCDGGEPRACANLGWRHRDGLGAPRDPRKAKALLQKACEGGVREACD